MNKCQRFSLFRVFVLWNKQFSLGKPRAMIQTSSSLSRPLCAGMEPIQQNSSASTGDVCLTLCQQRVCPHLGTPSASKLVKFKFFSSPRQLPSPTLDDEWWTRLYRRACRTLLVNEYQFRNSQEIRIKKKKQQKVQAKTIGGDSGSVRGCLQAYSRSSDTHIWVPMGAQYRKVLSCAHPQR